MGRGYEARKGIAGSGGKGYEAPRFVNNIVRKILERRGVIVNSDGGRG